MAWLRHSPAKSPKQLVDSRTTSGRHKLHEGGGDDSGDNSGYDGNGPVALPMPGLIDNAGPRRGSGARPSRLATTSITSTLANEFSTMLLTHSKPATSCSPAQVTQPTTESTSAASIPSILGHSQTPSAINLTLTASTSASTSTSEAAPSSPRSAAKQTLAGNQPSTAPNFPSSSLQTGSVTISSRSTLQTLGSKSAIPTTSGAGSNSTASPSSTPLGFMTNPSSSSSSSSSTVSSNNTGSSTAENSAPPILASGLNRQAKIGIGVGVGVGTWALISMSAFIFWFLRRRKRKQQQVPSAILSPQQIFFGAGDGTGTARIQASSQLQTQSQPPAVEIRRSWSVGFADASTGRELAPGLRSHPITTRNTMEDPESLSATRMLSELPSLPDNDGPRTPILGAAASHSMSSPSTHQLTDPKTPSHRSPDVRRPQSSRDDNRSVNSLSYPRLGTSKNVRRSALSMNETLALSEQVTALPLTLTKPRSWPEENRRRSRPENTQSP